MSVTVASRNELKWNFRNILGQNLNELTFQLYCGIIAGVLHYFFLAAFTWMLLEGFELYYMLVEVFQSRDSKKPYFYLFGYGWFFTCPHAELVKEPFLIWLCSLDSFNMTQKFRASSKTPDVCQSSKFLNMELAPKYIVSFEANLHLES